MLDHHGTTHPLNSELFTMDERIIPVYACLLKIYLPALEFEILILVIYDVG
jgi:hypothetical protein